MQGEISIMDLMDDQGARMFAPVATDLVSSLIGRYRQERQNIDSIFEFSKSKEFSSAIGYFLTGNATEGRGHTSMSLSAAQLFQIEGAVAALNAAYWQQAMSLTDVYDAMPQNRREEWRNMISHPHGTKKDYHEVRRDKDRNPEWFDDDGCYIDPENQWKQKPIPEFYEDTVRSTIQHLLLSRAQFFAERVDGVFRALSREHVTNCPQGFNKRMILTGITSSFSCTERVGYINDLRAVIAKFMGREEPKWNASSGIVSHAKHKRGEWVSVDGGALRIRCYLNGNAHLEVHPDMAWRLNCVLAQLHPLAIPSELRQKPKKVPKEFKTIQRPLPFAVLDLLGKLEQAKEFVENTGPDAWKHPKTSRILRNAVSLHYSAEVKGPVYDEVCSIIESLGGVPVAQGKNTYWQFDYDPREVLADIECSGCLPDVKTHQFYPTPEKLAKIAVEMADIGEDDECLEPSAGRGGIADHLPKERTICVEISELHCGILKAKGHNVEQADFLKWDACRDVDRILMNPPFSEGRWKLHVEHAATMVKRGGVLVAVLPSSAKTGLKLPGFDLEWSGVYENEFPGASVDVVIVRAVKL